MLDTEIKAIIEYFAKENDCTVLVIPNLERLMVIIDMRKSSKWAKRHEIRYEEFNEETLIEALNTMYEELTKGATE